MAEKHTTEERIAHFLRLAEDDGATQAERDLASAQAERLMLKHGIESIDLTTGLPRPEQIVKEQIFFAGSYAASRNALAFSILRALKLKGWHSTVSAQTARFYGAVAADGGHPRAAEYAKYRDHATGKIAAGELFTLVGFESDARDGANLIRSLDVQAAVALKAWWKAEGRHAYYWSEADKNAARRGFIESFGQGAAKRVEESRRVIVQEAEIAAPGTAVALVNKERAVADWVSANQSLRTGRRRASNFNSAGYAAGSNANVGGRGLGAGTRALSR